MAEDVKVNPVFKWLLVLVPALLAISAAGAVWFHWKSETNDDPNPGLALGVMALDDDELRDSVKKLQDYIGPREWETPEGRRQMRRVISLVGGTLSPQNYGYVVRKDGEVTLAGERWPTMWVDVEGTGKGLVVVAVPYDRGDLSVAAVLALAAQLRPSAPERGVRFVFYPSVLWEEKERPNVSFLGEADLVLCLNGLDGGGRDLWLLGPALAEDEQFFQSVVDGHDEAPGLRREATHFARLGPRVFEMRGMAGSGAERDPAATAGAPGREIADLKARVGRLEVILRAAAQVK